MAFLSNLLDRLRTSVMSRLEKENTTYQRFIYNNLESLHKNIHKGDVVLIEGKAEISRVIKLITTSQWSHIVYYVGDELIKTKNQRATEFVRLFGEDAKHMIIEAFAGLGVVAAPLSKYRDYNIRICRPYGIRKDDMQTVTNKVIGNLGRHYDQQNIIDIALMSLPDWMNPFKKRSTRACLGKCTEYQVICSGMIAQAFQSVGYPIVPVLTEPTDHREKDRDNPYGATLSMRHYSQILPRDFDLSPNFEIIKFNIIKNKKFNYRNLLWEKEEQKPGANASARLIERA